MHNDDQPRLPPEKFRASLDPKDKAAHERLLRNDEEQQILAAQQPFNHSPQARMRAKALITIESLTNPALNRTSDQNEILAEAYALTGQYDLAAQVSKHSDLYKKYRDAVYRDDEEWCEHEGHQFVKEYVYSVRDGKDKALVACAVCGHWNIIDTPDDLKAASKSRQQHRGKTAGMTIGQAKDYHTRNVK